MLENNSKSLEEKGIVDFTRQRDFYDPSQSDVRIVMAGCGGIGSATAVFLSKLGVPEISLIDPDVIEPHNKPNQFFPVSASYDGKPKVEVVKAMCKLLGTSTVYTQQSTVEDAATMLNGIVVTGFDNMKARAATWELVKDNNKVTHLIDGRIGGQEIVIWTIDLKDQSAREQYEEFALFTDEEGEEAPCTARAVIDVMGFVASTITRQVRQIASGEKAPTLLSLSVKDYELNSWGFKAQAKQEITEKETIDPFFEELEDGAEAEWQRVYDVNARRGDET